MPSPRSFGNITLGVTIESDIEPGPKNLIPSNESSQSQNVFFQSRQFPWPRQDKGHKLNVLSLLSRVRPEYGQ